MGDEVVTMMRKVSPTMSGKQVCEVMEAADANKNGTVDMAEFTRWLKNESSAQLREAVDRDLKTAADCVSASFRVWDKNGDGLIVMSELRSILKETCPQLTTNQVKTLCGAMDED